MTARYRGASARLGFGRLRFSERFFRLPETSLGLRQKKGRTPALRRRPPGCCDL